MSGRAKGIIVLIVAGAVGITLGLLFKPHIYSGLNAGVAVSLPWCAGDAGYEWRGTPGWFYCAN